MRAHPAETAFNTTTTDGLSLRAAAAALGVSKTTVARHRRLQADEDAKAAAAAAQHKPRIRIKAGSSLSPVELERSPDPIIVPAAGRPEKPLLGGSLAHPETRVQTKTGNRFVITSAQNNTEIHGAFFRSLIAYCNHNGSELLIAGYSYNKNAFSNPHQVTKDSADLWYAEELQPFLVNKPIRLAKDLVFCAELDISPTAVDPLSGLDSYTRSASGIFPHAKVAMKSMATMKNDAARFLYTTGTVTSLNYIQRKAGQKAEFDHVFGALVVEVDDDGDWFVRQINAGEDGSFYDLDSHYSACGITSARPEAITWGDFHEEKRSAVVEAACFDGDSSILESLRPREQHVHDLADFTARNHHNRGDAYFLAQMHFAGTASVEDGMRACGRKLAKIERDWCRTVVVESNHDQAFRRWLGEADGHRDPVNARYWHLWNLAMFTAIESQSHEPLIFEEAVRATTTDALKNTTFLREDDSWVLCREQGGIEAGLHGHRGPNGSRGSPRSFRQLGRRVNSAHAHSCSIFGGIYTAGVSGMLDMGYNRGPSSWSASHILTYANGKRTIVTMRGEKWRA
jgi:hypothetical protein